jgi:hypothetical protein
METFVFIVQSRDTNAAFVWMQPGSDGRVIRSPHLTLPSGHGKVRQVLCLRDNTRKQVSALRAALFLADKMTEKRILPSANPANRPA